MNSSVRICCLRPRDFSTKALTKSCPKKTSESTSNQIVLRTGKNPVRFMDFHNQNWSNFLSPVRIALTVHYTDSYPDELPELSLQPIDGEADEDDIGDLIASAQAVVSVLAHSHIIGFTPMWVE